MPEISVLMTVFNGRAFIAEAIESILNQTFKDFEFIIVDNASSDGTKGIVRSFNDSRIIFIENKTNLGQTKALNLGIKQAYGQFIARMDVDDVSLSERLELQYNYLMQDPSLAVLGSWHEEVDSKGRHIKYFKMPTDPLEIKSYLISPGKLGYYCLSHPTVMMRKDVLFEVGLYNDSYLAQDYDLWVRISRKYRISNLNKFLVKHRITNTQQTKELKQEIESDCKRIIISNILNYLPEIKEKELMSLARMLEYKPQISKEDGFRVLGTFNLLLDRVIDYANNNKTAMLLRIKMQCFYIPQLIKTNPLYSLMILIRIISCYPMVIFDAKLYRKLLNAAAS